MAVGYLVDTFTICCIRGQYRFYKTKMTSLLVPPVSVRGMTCLDRNAFTTTVNVPCLKLRDIALSKVMPILRKYLIKMRKFKPVENTSDGTFFYLNPKLIKNLDDITENDRKLLSNQYEYFPSTELTFKYENWRPEEIFKSVLPEGIEVPTSYSQVGHIIHLNLRDVHLPYKTLIGQVFLDNGPTARTVVNKINTIDTTFRHFTMEILVGDKDTITTTKEHGYTFQFDFAQVYWNPRLSTEHNTLITYMCPDDVMYDVFAGVGPFAIPAAHKKVQVFANDLNPECYKWLQKNATINKIKNNLKIFNIDGKEFLKTIVKTDILNRRSQNTNGTEHIVMNLPELAIEFLDTFFNCFTPEETKAICSKPPIIHLYCFIRMNKGDDASNLAKSYVEEKFGCVLDRNSLINIHNVRNVSPNKDMLRVSFFLTENILNGGEPAKKKLKIGNKTGLFINDDIVGDNGKEQGITKDEECIQSSDSP